MILKPSEAPRPSTLAGAVPVWPHGNGTDAVWPQSILHDGRNDAEHGQHDEEHGEGVWPLI